MQERYPQLIINLERIKENAKIMVTECKKRNLELVGVEKLVAGNLAVAKAYLESGIKTIGDSRIQNLKKLQNLNCKKMLLRIPMLSEIGDLLTYSDLCLISEIKTIRAINKNAKKPYEIILMIETGDIREGLLNRELIFKTVKEIQSLKNIKLIGLGTNFACYGATVPTIEKLQKLVKLKKDLEMEFKIQIKTISAGNSSHITIWNDKKMPSEINQIRSGAAILMGIGLSDAPIKFLHQDNFLLRAQVVEVQIKPSVSWGPRSLDAFAKEFSTPDIGDRKKAIVAIGRQDVGYESLTPVDSKIKILGGSSDHTILDITDSKTDYQVGDVVEFKLDYLGVLSCITSEFVEKKIEKFKK